VRKLKFEQRANHKHFSRRDDEWWDLKKVFNLEKKAIDIHLSNQARTNWRLFRSFDKAMAQWVALRAKIEATYTHTGIMPDKRIINEASAGDLKREAPTKGKIGTMTALLVLKPGQRILDASGSLSRSDFHP
jgi:hypothetical protein